MSSLLTLTFSLKYHRPVPVPANEFGKFYTGDAYIVLHTKEVKNRFEYHIHFWIGLESTIDEVSSVSVRC